MTDYTIQPFPASRNLVVDAGFLHSKRHVIHGLLEVDVTEARKNNQTNSFTAYLVACLAKTVAQDPSIQAYKNWRGQLVVFRTVDVVVLIEPEANAVAIPHIIRNADSKSVMEITQEIRNIQQHPKASAQNSKSIHWAAKLPRWIRMLAFRYMKWSPHRFRKYQGTVILTAVGMFGKHSGGYGMAFLPCHTLGVCVGGIQRKPGIVAVQEEEEGPLVENIVPRDFLNLTVSFDHDIIDGAPAARFTQKLVDQIESAGILKQETGCVKE
jgi:pyruvate/2-oxoglutarate dehydrogenase complex dihydrolipoamide acyltransferase (E2) component